MWNFHQSEKKPPVIKSDCYQKYSGVLEKNVKKFINVQPMYTYFITLPIRPKKYK